MSLAETTAVETTFADMLREQSGFELADLDRSASFLELGFDSLFLIQMCLEIQKRFKTKVTFRQLIEEMPTVEGLLAHLSANSPLANENAPAAAPAPAPTPPQPTPEPQPVAPPPQSAAPVAPAPVATPAPQVVEPQPVSPPATQMAPAPLSTQPVAMPPSAPAQQSAPLTGDMSAIERIITQQNHIMAEHLAFLRGAPAPQMPVSVAPAMPVAQSAPAPPAAPAPAPSENAAVASPIPAACNDGSCDTSSEQTVSTAIVDEERVLEQQKKTRFGPYKPVRRGTQELTERQSKHLSQFIERFTRRTAKSKRHAEAHREYFADPRGVAGYRRIWKSMVYQVTVEKSKGSKLWDIDGNEYVDIAMGFGLNLFGQSPDFVTKALHEQLDRGVEVAPQSPIAGDVAQLLSTFSRKDRVTFCNTGSEAVMAALRLARTVTNKPKFVFFNKDYHGNFDQVLLRSTRIGQNRRTSPAAPGVPREYAEAAIVLDYGTAEAMQTIQERADEIAAILIEPVQSNDIFVQPKEFLQEIRRVTRENNIAMIMDEVITGFRAAPGGAQEYFDVWGDMSTYGKVLGGGMPIGALAGSKEYMDALDGGMWRYDDDSEPDANMTFFAGTFVRHPLALAAAHQVLMRVKEDGPDLQKRLTEKTTHLVTTLNKFFEDEQFPIRVGQFTSQFRFVFPQDLEFADMLYFHLLDRGIFTRGWGDNCFLSTEHSDADVQRVIDAVIDSCREIRAGGFFPEPDESATTLTGSQTVDGNAALSFAADGEKKNIALSNPGDVVDGVVQEDPGAYESFFECLDPIQPEGDMPPLFCMPAADGLTLVYHEMSDHLGPNQPLYGLNSPGVVGEPLPDTLEKMSARFVREIREFRPHGPYLICGYCSGGTVALEVAQQLIAQGQDVAALLLIETYNWEDAPSTNPTKMIELGYSFQKFEFNVRNFLLLNMSEKWELLKSKWEALTTRHFNVWMGIISGWFRSNKQQASRAGKVNMAELWRIHDDLAEAYTPKEYPGKILHFRPRRDYSCHVSTPLPARDGQEEKRYRAYPSGMMVNPFVGEVSQDIANAIDRALREYDAVSRSKTTELVSRR